MKVELAGVTLKREEKRALLDKTHDSLFSRENRIAFSPENDAFEKKLRKLATAGGKKIYPFLYSVDRQVDITYVLVVQLFNTLKNYQRSGTNKSK